MADFPSSLLMLVFRDDLDPSQIELFLDDLRREEGLELLASRGRARIVQVPLGEETRLVGILNERSEYLERVEVRSAGIGSSAVSA